MRTYLRNRKGYQEQGHWKFLFKPLNWNGYSLDEVLEEFDYCPNCGARLTERNEDE